MNALSAFCLVTIVLVCLVGVFSPYYRDNWAQFFGLWGVIVWGSARLYQVVSGGYVSELGMFAQGSLALFAVGTATKLLRTHKARPGARRNRRATDWGDVAQ
jgi:hypothetical protein